MTKWEYCRDVAGNYAAESVRGEKSLSPFNATELWTARMNELGDEGWELVTEYFNSWPFQDKMTRQPLGDYLEFSGTFKRPKA